MPTLKVLQSSTPLSGSSSAHIESADVLGTKRCRNGEEDAESGSYHETNSDIGELTLRIYPQTKPLQTRQMS